MGNVLKSPTHKARLSRQGHDLSHRFMFTSSSGQLLPVLTDFLDPGESIRINSNLFTRTQPLKTPAFVRITEHIDYFFVPMSQINEYFGNSFYGIDDSTNPNNFLTQGASAQRNPYTLPYLTSGFIYNVLNANSAAIEDSSVTSGNVHFAVSPRVDEFNIPVFSNFLRLASHLGYSEHLTTRMNSDTSSSNQGIPLFLDLFAVYQKIFMDYYRLTDWTRDNPYAYSITYWSKVGSFANAITGLGVNIYGDLFKLRYSPLKKDFFTNILPTPLFTSVGLVNSYSQSLGGNTNSNTYFNTAILSQYGINYQYLQGVLGSWDSEGKASRYSLGQAGSRGALGLQEYGTVPSNIDGGSPINNNSALDTGIQPSVNTEQFSAYSASVIRTMFAIDRLKAITRRAKAHYDAQTLAHFGVSVPQGISNEVYYLGSHTSPLSIGEIASTATTGSGENSSVLGQLAGRGIGSSTKQKTIKFKAPCHGYLMAIYRAVPEIDYSSFAVDKQVVARSISQFYHPEFDNLGMQPLYAFQFYYRNTFFTYNGSPTTSDGSADPNPSVSQFLGWQYRYMEYKTKYNRVSGAFNYGLKDWVSTRNGSWFENYHGSSPTLSESYFYAPPTLFDNIFLISFEPMNLGSNDNPGYAWGVFTSVENKMSLLNDVSISPVFERDPLLHSIDFKYYKVSSKSTYGLPNL
ncbi:major capsid protein [Dipodfec virus UOA04_Rod_386]|nr:major capsid protein [Dipodfec virus UOA04_Rod_386]